MALKTGSESVHYFSTFFLIFQNSFLPLARLFLFLPACESRAMKVYFGRSKVLLLHSPVPESRSVPFLKKL